MLIPVAARDFLDPRVRSEIHISFRLALWSDRHFTLDPVLALHPRWDVRHPLIGQGNVRHTDEIDGHARALQLFGQIIGEHHLRLFRTLLTPKQRERGRLW